MTIRLILVLTVFALVLGGVGAAFVQAQPGDSDSPVAPDPAWTPDPAKKPEPAKASVKSDARHDDVQSELEAVEVKWDDDDDQGGDDNSLASAPSAPSAASVPSAPSAASAPSAPSAPSAASVPSAPSAASTDD